MSAANADPAWLKLAIALSQAGVGAASALIAVFLTQRSTQKERRLKTFEKMNEPFLRAHTEMFSELVALQDILAIEPRERTRKSPAARQQFADKVRHRLVWMDEAVAEQCVDIAERLASSDVGTEDVCRQVQQQIVRCQRSIREVIGVPQFKTVVDEMRKG